MFRSYSQRLVDTQTLLADGGLKFYLKFKKNYCIIICLSTCLRLLIWDLSLRLLWEGTDREPTWYLVLSSKQDKIICFSLIVAIALKSEIRRPLVGIPTMKFKYHSVRVFFKNTNLSYPLNFIFALFFATSRGIPLPSRGKVGKNRSPRSKTTVRSKRVSPLGSNGAPLLGSHSDIL